MAIGTLTPRVVDALGNTVRKAKLKVGKLASPVNHPSGVKSAPRAKQFKGKN
jgi:hypothetical protein